MALNIKKCYQFQYIKKVCTIIKSEVIGNYICYVSESKNEDAICKWSFSRNNETSYKGSPFKSLEGALKAFDKWKEDHVDN